MFRATGESKAAARFNAAQTAYNALRPKIEAELQRRKVEKEQKMEAKKAERFELLKQREEAAEAAGGSADTVTDDDKHDEDTEQKPKVTADTGTEDDQETKLRLKGKGAIRVLKDIRPGISCVGNTIADSPTGDYMAEVVVDGCTFERRGNSLALAKALAAAAALSTLFSLSFEYSPRKTFIQYDGAL